MMILSETSMLNYFLNQTLVGTMLFDSDLKKRRGKNCKRFYGSQF